MILPISMNTCTQQFIKNSSICKKLLYFYRSKYEIFVDVVTLSHVKCVKCVCGLLFWVVIKFAGNLIKKLCITELVGILLSTQRLNT